MATNGAAPHKKAAVLLAGCGVYDGTEIQEAMAAIFELSKGGADISYFAPDMEQMHVIDHT